MTEPDLDAIPTALTEWERWVVWREEQRTTKDGETRVTKVPYATSGRAASSTDPATWAAFDTAAGVYRHANPGVFHGIGINLGALDETLLLCGLDLDSCVDADGNIAPWAQTVLAALVSTYREHSPSGFGVKAFFMCSAEDAEAVRALFGIAAKKWGSKRSVAGHSNGSQHGPAVEIYFGGRYFAVTGRPVTGAPDSIATFDRVQLEELAWAINAVVVSTDKKKKPRDTSRSAAAFRLGARLIRQGATYDEMCTALREHEGTAEWYQEKGVVNDERELKNIWHNAGGDDTRPIIRIVEGEMERLADEAEQALTDAGCELYQRGDYLCFPTQTPLTTASGATVMSASLHRADTYHLLDRFCRHARWVRYSKREGAYVAADPPLAVARILVGRTGDWHVPTVRGIVSTPTLRADGSILSSPGFDTASGLYLYLDKEFVMPEIPEEPTREDALAAIALLDGLLTEFPFVDDASESVALSLIITTVIRGAMPVAPLHAASAPAAGTGKSYLMDIASAVASGERCPVIYAGTGLEEVEKKISGLLITGVPLFSIDNMVAPLGGDVLSQATERPLLSLRWLGKSDPIRTVNTALIGATGNNLVVEGDLTRRVVQATLDAKLERPELRPFKANPFEQVLANRGAYVSAVLTIVRAYLCDPSAEDPYPLGSYEEWTHLVRGPLVWLGRTDPANTMAALREADPTTNELVAVMNAWEAAIGLDQERSTAEVATGINDEPELPRSTDYPDTVTWQTAVNQIKAAWAALGTALVTACGERGRVTARQIGWWLGTMRNRVSSNRRFTAGSKQTRPQLWKLEDTTP
jgi:putative DNA primase/helicase